MQALYLTLETIEESIGYTVSPFQHIVFSSMDFLNAQLQRDTQTLTLLFNEQGKAIFLYDFFKGEQLGFFPTFVLPSQECISGFGFIALLNPSLVQENIIHKGGVYGKPEGSFIEYTTYKKQTEENIPWNVSPILFTAPKSTVETLIQINSVMDESPEFYETIESYLHDIKQQNASAPLYQEEESYTQEYEEEQEEQEQYNASVTQDNAESNNFPSYHSGYVLTQEQIQEGYRVIDVNGDPNELEQMVGGYYGYITLASEGWFTYILGEGVTPEMDSYLEDSYSYTIQTPQGSTVEASITIQSYYQDGVLAYQEYHTEI